MTTRLYERCPLCVSAAGVPLKGPRTGLACPSCLGEHYVASGKTVEEVELLHDLVREAVRRYRADVADDDASGQPTDKIWGLSIVAARRLMARLGIDAQYPNVAAKDAAILELQEMVSAAQSDRNRMLRERDEARAEVERLKEDLCL